MPEEPTIKAIPTKYRGYKFRSRLEARWAVFLDCLGLEWQYEPEGFDLGGGLYYLPDFYIPSLDAWIEVKGQKPTEGDDAWQKVQMLALQTGQNTYLFSGQFTSPSNLMGLSFSTCHLDGVPFAPWHVWWFKCPVCHKWGLSARLATLPCSCLDYSPNEQAECWDAVERSKQARFEHGECG